MDGGYTNYGNYSTTTYSAGGGADGGGFLKSGAENSPSGGSSFKNDSLRPVTIKQLLEAESSDNTDFRIDNAHISQVTIIGQVRNISQQTTNITYRLDDGTGVIEVKVWIDPEAAEPSPAKKIVENVYVRVWGRLKAFNNKRHLGGHFIRPLPDYNEVNYHLLEATMAHLHFTRGPPPSGEGDSKAGALGNGAANGNSAAGKLHGTENPLPPGLGTAARKIYHVLRTTPTGNEGMHMSDMAARAGMEYGEVSNGVSELQENGLIFSTSDDSTWQLLNMG